MKETWKERGRGQGRKRVSGGKIEAIKAIQIELYGVQWTPSRYLLLLLRFTGKLWAKYQPVTSRVFIRFTLNFAESSKMFVQVWMNLTMSSQIMEWQISLGEISSGEGGRWGWGGQFRHCEVSPCIGRGIEIGLSGVRSWNILIRQSLTQTQWPTLGWVPGILASVLIEYKCMFYGGRSPPWWLLHGQSNWILRGMHDHTILAVFLHTFFDQKDQSSHWFILTLECFHISGWTVLCRLH